MRKPLSAKTRALWIAGLLAAPWIAGGVFRKSRTPSEDPTSQSGRPGDAPVFFRQTETLAPGGSIALLDLDALTENLTTVRRKLGDRFRLRWVAKSLPSTQLLQWLAHHGGSDRFMVFQAEMVSELLRSIPHADLWMGKPLPAAAAERTLAGNPNIAGRVTWLLDSLARVEEYESLARKQRATLRVALEIDVGLRRGGFETQESFERALQRIQASSQSGSGGLRFLGLMGYDGHVPHAEALLGPGKNRAAAREFDLVQKRYSEFVKTLVRVAPERAKTATFNGGGSRTYWRYAETRESPLNEIALGSALLKPSHFDDPELGDLKPAAYLRIPVLKKVHFPFPFVPGLWPWIAKAFPETEYGIYLYGSIWGGTVVWPAGLHEAWFHSTGIQNLYPNQQLLMTSASHAAQVGDFVWVRPAESDIIAGFDSIYATGMNQRPIRWSPVSHRN